MHIIDKILQNSVLAVGICEEEVKRQYLIDVLKRQESVVNSLAGGEGR